MHSAIIALAKDQTKKYGNKNNALCHIGPDSEQRVEMQMSLRKNLTPRKDAQKAFPPEADGDFPEVKLSEVAEWRDRLAAEFGFGNGKWKEVESAS